MFVHTIAYLCALPRNLYAAAESGFNLIASSQSRIAALTLFCFNSIFALFAYNMADPAHKKMKFLIIFYNILYSFPIHSILLVCVKCFKRWNTRQSLLLNFKKKQLPSIYRE